MQLISLSPVPSSETEQPHAPAQLITVLPRSRQPTYVAQAAFCTQSHHSVSQWAAMQSLQCMSSVSGVHAGASGPPPLDEPLASAPELLPEELPVDASPPPPDEKAAPPQWAASARGASTKRRAEARLKGSISKPA